jgi:hypothetical protein
MVGLLSALPQTRLWHRLKREGRLETESTGNNTEAALNFKPKLSKELLVSGYRDLMKKIYEPHHYYQRIRMFLKSHRPCGPRLRVSRADLIAFLKSFWVLGVWHRGRVGYWRLFWSTLLKRPRQFPHAIELAILGYHFRRVAKRLQLRRPFAPSIWQRRQRHAAELDFAALGLQSERPRHEFDAGNLIDLLAVHRNRVRAAGGEDVHLIPFAGGLFSVRGLLHPRDVTRDFVRLDLEESRLARGHGHALQAQHVTRVAMLELDLRTARQRPRGAVDTGEDAAVPRLGAGRPAILQHQTEVREGAFGMQHTQRRAFADENAILHRPDGVARHGGIVKHVRPAGEVFAVEQLLWRNGRASLQTVAAGHGAQRRETGDREN